MYQRVLYTTLSPSRRKNKLQGIHIEYSQGLSFNPSLVAWGYQRGWKHRISMIQRNHLKISSIPNFCILIEGEVYKSSLSRFLSCTWILLQGEHLFFCNLFQFLLRSQPKSTFWYCYITNICQTLIIDINCITAHYKNFLNFTKFTHTQIFFSGFCG